MNRFRATTFSAAIHAVAVVLLLLVSGQAVRKPAPVSVVRATPLISPFRPRKVLATPGGGGARDPLPARLGRPPKAAPRQFVPPMVPTNPAPKLTMQASIEAPPDAEFRSDLVNLGDPLGRFLNGGGGRGGPRGIGNGGNGGVGAGDSSGIGTVYRPGGGVTLPVLIHSVDPEFSEEARKAKYSGKVMLQADIDATGRPRNIRLVRSLGMGLDEKAVEAVLQWRFRPGSKDGRPVAVAAMIEVSFHLL